MKQYFIQIKPTAEIDVTTRYLQIAEDSPQNALNWYRHIIQSIYKLDYMPERCPIAPEDKDVDEEIRHLIIDNYRVLFRINDDVIEILHIRHSAMDRKL